MACSFGRSRAVVKGWQEHSLLPTIASQQMPKAGRPWAAMDDHGWPGNACQCLAMLGYAGPTRAYSSILELLMAAYGCLALPAMLCSALQCSGGAWRWQGSLRPFGMLGVMHRDPHGPTMTIHDPPSLAAQCAAMCDYHRLPCSGEELCQDASAGRCQNQKGPRITVPVTQ